MFVPNTLLLVLAGIVAVAVSYVLLPIYVVFFVVAALGYTAGAIFYPFRQGKGAVVSPPITKSPTVAVA